MPYDAAPHGPGPHAAALAELGSPEQSLPAVHIAGTKGKGSTAAMIAAALSACGLRTGLFTSPHLERIEERIRSTASASTAEEFETLVELVRPAVERLDCEGAGRRSRES